MVEFPGGLLASPFGPPETAGDVPSGGFSAPLLSTCVFSMFCSKRAGVAKAWGCAGPVSFLSLQLAEGEVCQDGGGCFEGTRLGRVKQHTRFI